MQDTEGVELTVPLDTVCFIVERAHDLQGKTGRSAAADEDDPAVNILQAGGDDPVEQELTSVIADLDIDAQIDLVTLMWLGRDETADWGELRATAVQEHTGATPAYLCGTPLLADYLLAGLDRLGLDCAAWNARNEL